MSKIKSIKGIPLRCPEPHYKGVMRCVTLARVESADGLVGWGESISQMDEATLATALMIEQGFAPLLVGEDGADVVRLWKLMQEKAWWYGPQGIAGNAISAVDMALWDLAGKEFGVPVCTLLGGTAMDRVTAMASIVFDLEDLDWTVSEFAWMKEQGYHQVKGGWGMRPEAMFGMDRRADHELLRGIRDAIGEEIELVADMPGHHRIWDVQTAIRRVRELEPFRLRWMEEPLPNWDLAGHRRLRDGVSTPIGTGEKEWTPESYSNLIRSGGVDVVQMDPGRSQGITGCQRVIREVEAANLQFSMHTWSSAINTAAGVHLVATSTHNAGMDFKPHESPLQHEMVNDPWEQRDGYLEVRDLPGLGVDVREEIVEKYTFG